MAEGYCMNGGVGHQGLHPLGPYCFMGREPLFGADGEPLSGGHPDYPDEDDWIG